MEVSFVTVSNSISISHTWYKSTTRTTTTVVVVYLYQNVKYFLSGANSCILQKAFFCNNKFRVTGWNNTTNGSVGYSTRLVHVYRHIIALFYRLPLTTEAAAKQTKPIPLNVWVNSKSAPVDRCSISCKKWHRHLPFIQNVVHFTTLLWDIPTLRTCIFVKMSVSSSSSRWS